MPQSRRLSEFPDVVRQIAPGQAVNPEKIASQSNKKIDWVCDEGHRWPAVIAARVKGSGCPYCRNFWVLEGYNDLQTLFPAIAAEWHPTKNGDVLPSQVLAGSEKKYWWQCSVGHSYDTKPGSRTRRGTGCRICSGNEVQREYNDLATERPDIAAEWHPGLNGNLTPENVSRGSPKKRWWLCPRFGHTYEMSVSKRTGEKQGNCPYCSSQKLLPGFNDLAAREPELAEQWDCERNGGLTPDQVSRSSRIEVWWVCPNGAHKGWKQSPRNRHVGCGICQNQTLLQGFNDVATAHPKWAKEWHPTLNGDKSPDRTLAGGRQKIWWLCELGHDWRAAIYARGEACPFCSFRKLWPGFNDLETVEPELAKEWHPTKNGNLTPQNVMSSVARVVWWQCPRGHAYQASPNARSRIGARGRRGCNICANKVVLRGVNHLSSTHPNLWKELVKDTVPVDKLEKIHSGSVAKLTWRCRQGHEWSAATYSRVAGNGCPECAEYGFKLDKPSVVYFLRHHHLNARKVGITNTHNRYDRVAAFKFNGWTVVKKWPMEGRTARAIESLALAWIRGELRLPQYLGRQDMRRTGGETETFSSDGPSDREVIRKIEEFIDSHGKRIVSRN